MAITTIDEFNDETAMRFETFLADNFAFVTCLELGMQTGGVVWINQTGIVTRFHQKDAIVQHCKLRGLPYVMIAHSFFFFPAEHETIGEIVDMYYDTVDEDDD